MSKSIKVNIFSQRSINNAIKQIENYQKELEQKTNDFLDKLAEKCVSEIKKRYDAINYSGTGIDDTKERYVSYILDEDNHTARVFARGTQILFIEFGTGPLSLDHQPARAAIKSGEVLKHKEWSEKKGKNKIQEDGTWTYNGITTTGFHARAPFYLGKLEMERLAGQIARGVFEQ